MKPKEPKVFELFRRLGAIDRLATIEVAGDKFYVLGSTIDYHAASLSLEIKDCRQEPWNGQGLPPVGTVCEFAGGTQCPEDPWHPDLKVGTEVTVIAHFADCGGPLAAFTFKAINPSIGPVQVEQGRAGVFRPIRTAEQIAAEARQEEIKKIAAVMSETILATGSASVSAMAEAVYCDGYRKQVTQ